MTKRLPLAFVIVLLFALAPLSVMAQTSSVSGIVANLDTALQRVGAQDAAGALTAVNAADKLFDDVEKTLEQQNLAAERQIEDGIDAAKSALSATPPNFAAAGQQLQTARTTAGQFAAPAQAPSMPKAGGGGAELPPSRAGWIVLGALSVCLALLAWAVPGSRFMPRRAKRDNLE